MDWFTVIEIATGIMMYVSMVLSRPAKPIECRLYIWTVEHCPCDDYRKAMTTLYMTDATVTLIEPSDIIQC